MKLWKTTAGWWAESEGKFYALPSGPLLGRDDLPEYLRSFVAGASGAASLSGTPVAPIEDQEVWAAGVTYFRSRSARMEESKDAGGGSFYDRVYNAERPELFFKSPAPRVRGPEQNVRIRRDSQWNVPEPELTLVIAAGGRIVGFTIGNDMSSRDIEGENPLYLPQAKVYDGACAIGPSILVTREPLSRDTGIELRIHRHGGLSFAGSTKLAEMKRDPQDLANWLYRETSFADGCFLLTGTGIVPPDDFTLQSGDVIQIEIEGIGTLQNQVA